MTEGDVVEMSAMQTSVNSEITVEQALREVLKSAVKSDVAVCGLREVVKTLDRGNAVFCVLAESCNHDGYVKLVTALCAENKIFLLKVPESSQLGEWAGFCKIDKNGDVRKVVPCSCVAVKEFPDNSAFSRILSEHLKAAASQ